MYRQILARRKPTNDYFCKQSFVDDKNTQLPDRNASNIILVDEIEIKQQDVLDVLQNAKYWQSIWSGYYKPKTS